MQLNLLADILSQISHRPWPLPKSKPFMIQYWEELLFLHWEISKQFLDEILPQGLESRYISRKGLRRFSSFSNERS